MDERPWKPSANPNGLVAAVFARDENEAHQYCELLEDHDIPAIVGDEKMGETDEMKETAAKGAAPAISRGVPVLVPEVLLDEAGEVIADHDDTGDFQFDDDDDDELEDDDDFEFTQSPDGHSIGDPLDDGDDDGDDDDDPFDDDRFLDDEDDENA